MWDCLSHRVDAWMAQCPLCVTPVRKERDGGGGRGGGINEEEEKKKIGI